MLVCVHPHTHVLAILVELMVESLDTEVRLSRLNPNNANLGQVT